MAGIQSLMQAPGQAQQAPLPGMMPRPTSATPESYLAQLKGYSSEQLKIMAAQDPSWALLSAYNDALKREKLDAARKGLLAQMTSAATQNRTVKDDMLAQPVMAAHGGMMHGYAGGGAVAFTNGGNPTVEQILQKAPSARTPEENEILRTAGVELTRRTLPEGGVSALNKMLEGPFFRRLFTGDTYKLSPEELAKRTDTGATTERMFRALGGSQFVEPTVAAAQETPAARPDIPRFTSHELERYVKTAAPAPAPAPSALSGGQRQPAEAPAPAPAPITGLPALSPERARERTQELTQAEKLATDQAAVVERLSKTSPEVLAARENLQRIMGSAYDPQKKTLEEAKDLYARGIGSSGEALGRMAAAMGGAKRLGQGLAAAAGAGSQFVGEQRKRVEDLQDKYNSLKSQLDITMAQAQYADVIGDDKLKRDALTKAEEIKKNLFDTQRGIRKEYFGEQVQQAQGIAALRDAASRETQARAAMIQAGKPSEIQQREALYRRDPSAYEAMYGAKESAAVANLVRAINSDYALKSLAEALKLGTPEAQARYDARYKELVATYAPELLLGAGRGGASSGALEAATAIARGGK